MTMERYGQLLAIFHTEVKKMNKSREMTLQRLSRIGDLAAAESVTHVEKPVMVSMVIKGKPVGTLTIEAALGAYLSGKKRVQDVYINTSKDPKQQLSYQMAEYMVTLEESQHANAKAGDTDGKSQEELEQERQKKTEQILKTNKSARYQFAHYRKQEKEELSVYDKLDANRCSGFLLYSYDKNGVHSVLGENISPGSYGGRITSGSFASKA